MTDLGPEASTSVLVVDDHPLTRLGVIRALAAAGLDSVAEAGTGAEALEAVRDREPGLVVLDLALADAEDGLDLIPRIVETCPTRVLVFSMHDENVYADRCLRAGAAGYVEKAAGADTLLDAVRTVLAGHIWLSPGVRERLVRRAAGRDVPARDVERLTDREIEVFRKLGEGASTREIAGSLRLSIKTVETHRAKIKRKLDLENAAQLVHRAISWVRGDDA